MRRFVAHLLAVLALAVGALLVAAAPAGAAPTAATPSAVVMTGIGTDCLHPPDPASPTSGLSAWIDPGPENPRTGDPFAARPKQVAPADPQSAPSVKAPEGPPSMYDVYGYAGLEIVRYDGGCDVGSGKGESIVNDIWTAIANLFQGISVVLIALTVRLYRTIINPSFGSIFDPVQRALQEVVGNALFIPLIGLVIAATAVYYAVRSYRGEVDDALHGTRNMLGIVALGVVCTVYPLTVGATVDRAIGTVISITAEAATGQDGAGREPADNLAAAVQASTVYQAWVQGTFGVGKVNDEAAKKYGPRLFAAATYTRSERAALDADPSKESDMADLKREHYKEVAKKIEDEYPDVYQHVAGNRATSAIGFALAGAVAAVISLLFLVIALVQIAFAILVIRLAIGFLPLIALAAAFPRLNFLVKSLFEVVGTALAKGATYGPAAILFTVVAIGTIMSPDSPLDPIVKIFGILALTMAALYMMKLAKAIGARRKSEQDDKDRDRNGGSGQGKAPLELPPGTGGAGSSDGFDRSRGAPVDIGYMRASRMARASAATARPAASAARSIGAGAARSGRAIGAGAAKAGGAAAVGGARGGVLGAGRGLATGAAITAATAGVGAATLASSTAKGAATGAAKGAITAGAKSATRTAAKAGAKSAATAPGKAARATATAARSAAGSTSAARSDRTVSGLVIYHPASPSRPGSGGAVPGPGGSALPPRGGSRLAGAGGKRAASVTPTYRVTSVGGKK